MASARGKRVRIGNAVRNWGTRLRGRGASTAGGAVFPHPAAPHEERGSDPGDLWRLRASVPDAPGLLARVAAGLADRGGDIRTVQVHPTPDGAVDEILLHAPRGVEAADLVGAVGEAGGRDVRAARADVRELEDLPTRAFALAAQLVDGSVETTTALRRTLGDIEIGWREGEGNAAEELTERGMSLPAPGGGVFWIERRGPAFTPAEFARARALTSMATACRDKFRDEGEVVSVAGTRLRLRRADRRDLDQVVDFQRRCSAAARHERYFAPTPAENQHTSLRRLLTPALGRTWVVERERGEIVGMGNLAYEGTGAEIGLLVRDDWQCRGIGSMLAARLVAEADALAFTSITAHTRVHNTAIARTLRSAGLELAGVPEPGEWRWARTAREGASRAVSSTMDEMR